MQLFQCPNCSKRLYFENSRCTHCEAIVGYDLPGNRFVVIGGEEGWRYCGNAESGACNWALDQDTPGNFCLSCRLNEIVPPVDDPVHRRRWIDVEGAKRRLVYGLWRLGLPVEPKAEMVGGLAFRILVDSQHGGVGEVSMGHEDGVITIDATEADAPERENRRVELQESFRTLLGHMRHESGHYYWDRLIANTPLLEEFRTLFGDERDDYEVAKARHYTAGPPADWQGHYISAYATMHPWEDWAESWAHFLHMVDAVETAAAHGLWVAAATTPVPPPSRSSDDFDLLYDRWQDVLLVMNSMNRSLGHQDFYPFVVNTVPRSKLQFLHRVVSARSDDPVPVLAELPKEMSAPDQ